MASGKIHIWIREPDDCEVAEVDGYALARSCSESETTYSAELKKGYAEIEVPAGCYIVGAMFESGCCGGAKETMVTFECGEIVCANLIREYAGEPIMRLPSLVSHAREAGIGDEKINEIVELLGKIAVTVPEKKVRRFSEEELRLKREVSDESHGEILDQFESILKNPQSRQTFHVRGRHLYDKSGRQVILRGVNKMAVWTDHDPTCATIFPEIKKTGANVVRIVWLTDSSGNNNATVANMDAVIQNCRDNKMVPMIELHDATGDWSRLGSLVKFWTRPDVVNVVNKHKEYLLLNIGNEVGSDEVTDQQFKSGYLSAITAIRNAGVKVPLVIDAAYFGQEMSYILNNASDLIANDPEHNLIFSLHVWWHYNHPNASSDFVNAVDAVVSQNIPFIVGEFSGVCQECDNINNDSPYSDILNKCQQASIGWIAWEWGPGNEFGDPPCPAMNMTTDGQYATIQDGWARTVAIDHPYSIKNTAATVF